MNNQQTSYVVNLTGNLATQAAKYSRSFNRFSQSTARSCAAASRAVKGLSHSIDRMGNVAIPVLGVGIGASAVTATRSLIKTASAFEVMRIRVKQTFGQDAEKTLAWITEFATNTPMEFEDVVEAAMRLKTAGIDPLNGSLQALVDYNAKMGGNAEVLNSRIGILSNANIKGKLSWEEIKPLLESKVPVFELLAKASKGKYNADQIKELMTQGKLGRSAINALYREMGKDAQGAAKEQMQTWVGMASNLQDAMTTFKMQIMDSGAFDSLKAEFANLLEWINAKIESGELRETAKEISDTIVTAIHAIKEAVTEIYPYLQKLGKIVSWVADKAGGYGKLAMLAASIWAVNKALRSSLVRGGANLLMRGVGLLGRNRGGAGGALSTIASAANVQKVFVVNMPVSLGGRSRAGRGGRGGRRSRTAGGGGAIKGKAKKVPKTPKTPKSAKVPKVADSIPAKVPKASKISKVPKAVKGVGKRLGVVGTALTIADMGMTLMDDEATQKEKYEAVGGAAGSLGGAAAGAAAGAAIGSVVPVVGTAIGGIVGGIIGSIGGESIGSWLGGWFADDEKDKAKTADHADAIAQAIKNSAPQGEIKVELVMPKGMSANVLSSDLEIKTKTGYTGQLLYQGR